MNCPLRWSALEGETLQGDAEIEDAIRAAVRPEPILTVSQWADRYRILSTRLAAEAGRYRSANALLARDYGCAVARPFGQAGGVHEGGPGRSYRSREQLARLHHSLVAGPSYGRLAHRGHGKEGFATAGGPADRGQP